MTDTPNTVTTPSQRGSTAPLPAEETERSPAARIDPLGGAGMAVLIDYCPLAVTFVTWALAGWLAWRVA